AALLGARTAWTPQVNIVSSTSGVAPAVDSVAVVPIAWTYRSGSTSAIGPGRSTAAVRAVSWSGYADTSATPRSRSTSPSASQSGVVKPASAESTAWIPATRLSSRVAPDQSSSSNTRYLPVVPLAADVIAAPSSLASPRATDGSAWSG